MTTDEAKKLMCPIMSMPKGRDVYVRFECVADGCAWWRWEVTNPDYKGPEGNYHEHGYCAVGGYYHER